MEIHRFLGSDPNTVVKLDQKEISVNDKASMFLVYKYLCDGNVSEQCSVVVTSAMNVPVCTVHSESHK